LNAICFVKTSVNEPFLKAGNNSYVYNYRFTWYSY